MEKHMLKVRAGDSIYHKPSGYILRVGYVNTNSNCISTLGWPESYVDVKDCEIDEKCSDEEHIKLLRELASSKNGLRASEMAILTLYEMEIYVPFVGTTHKYVKSGKYYHVITEGRIEQTLQPVVIYKGLNNDVWVRPKDEFTDGRFVKL
jgi:hypothetical protein